jgi:methylmalonyl-CoA/ethylmalonyl-CoA epimerase
MLPFCRPSVRTRSSRKKSHSDRQPCLFDGEEYRWRVSIAWLGPAFPLETERAVSEDGGMKKLVFVLAFLPAMAPAQIPAYHDSGMNVVTQVAIVCRDIEATSKRWAAVLGVDPPQIRTTKPGHEVKVMYRGHPSEGQAKLAFIKLGQVTLELIQPVGGDTSWKQFLDTNGEGVQHIAFQVADLDKTIKGFGETGMPVLHQGRYDDDSGAYVYLDSAKALGVTLELLRSEPKK